VHIRSVGGICYVGAGTCDIRGGVTAGGIYLPQGAAVDATHD
jgi:hypothetical protein